MCMSLSATLLRNKHSVLLKIPFRTTQTSIFFNLKRLSLGRDKRFNMTVPIGQTLTSPPAKPEDYLIYSLQQAGSAAAARLRRFRSDFDNTFYLLEHRLRASLFCRITMHNQQVPVSL